MAGQNDAPGQNLNILLRYRLVPPGKAGTAAAFAPSMNSLNDTASNIRLTALTEGWPSGAAGYLLADPVRHAGLDVFVTAGSDGVPRLGRSPACSVPSNQGDGVYYRLGDDAVCVPSGYRASVQGPWRITI